MKTGLLRKNMVLALAAILLMTNPALIQAAADSEVIDTEVPALSTSDSEDPTEDYAADVAIEEPAADPESDEEVPAEVPAQDIQYDELDAETEETPEEDMVGTDNIPVGDRVTASYNSWDIVLYSNGGTLWTDWISQTDVNVIYTVNVSESSSTVYCPPNSSSLFSHGFLKEIDLSKIDTSKATTMKRMFYDDYQITGLDLSKFNTSNVTNMSGMFYWCRDIRDLNLSGFNTSKVTDMSEMFYYCENLRNLDISGFDTSKVTNTDNMFYKCDKIWTIKTPKKNTCSVKLPIPMYDAAGNEYTTLPILSRSIYIAKTQEMAQYFTDNFSNNDLASAQVTLSSSSYTYDGKEKKPGVTVKYKDLTLEAGKDYPVKYSNNINAGTATIKVEGAGSYVGTIYASFTINKANAKLTFASGYITKKANDAAFTNALTKTTDGSVSFSSSNTNVATVDSTSGRVTIKGSGTTTIRANASEGKNYKAASAQYTLSVLALTPTPKPTAKPTATPKPTAKPTATPRPTATPTVKPTVTPTPKPTVTPTVKPSQTGSSFSDVQDPKHPYYKAIYWAKRNGITKGFDDGTFGIDKPCTRGQAVMFLWRMAGKPAPLRESGMTFIDVPKSHPFYNAILWAKQYGITKGYTNGIKKGQFGIDETCTRGQIMMFIWRYSDMPEPVARSKTPFVDVPMSHPFYKAILWGYQEKITKGYTTGEKRGTFGIDEDCTRGQIVTFLYRLW